jgi:uncharacterized membrane protein YccC
MHNVANFEPPPPSQLNAEVPPLLDLVVKRAMAKKPSARYASAWEMVDDLRHCLQELAPSTVTLQRTTGMQDKQDEEDAANKTIALKPSSANKPAMRRMSADVETESRLTLSRRFDSEQAMARLQAPTPRDRKRLARSPHSPGILRRLRHDRDLIWFTMTLGLSILIAGALVLS